MSDRMIRTLSRAGLYDWNNQVHYPAPAAAVGLLLDGLDSYDFAYSSRKLRTAYAGSALEARRSSDNSTANVGFDGSNNLDSSALLAHVTNAGSQPTNSGFIRTWYDQSGNGVAVAETVTPAAQPRIVNAGTIDTLNGHPCSTWLGDTTVQQSLQGSRTLPQPMTLAACFRMDDKSKSRLAGITDGTSGSRVLFGTTFDGGYPFQIYAGAGPALTGDMVVDGTIYAVFAVFNGASSNLYVNGTQVLTNVNAGTNGFTGGFSVGSDNGPATGINAHLAELIAFSKILSSTEMNTIRADWQSYWGAP